jgi:5-methylthioadenosine/S-adenosylhomocysteine deaminase
MQQQTIDALVRARWVIPVEPDGLVHEHYALAVHRGRILDILPQRDAEERYRPAVTLDRPEHAIIPGFVNAHTHAAMSLFRGLADDLPLMDWLGGHIWPAEGKWVAPQFVRDGTELAVAEMLRGGTTCFNDMYFFPDATARVAAEAGIRATVGIIVIDFPSAWARNADEYVTKGLELHDEYVSHPLVRTAFAPHAPYTVSDTPLERIRVLADELEIPVHMHVHETAAEVQQAVAANGERPLTRLTRLGLVSPTLLAVHMTQLTDQEIAAYAAGGGHVLHCPESNMKLASGFCPVHRLTQAGVNVALGTDGAASNNDLDMFVEMRLASLLAKGVADDARALPAAAALRMATLNGARALGIDAETGSLVRGKSADFVCVHLGGVETEPVYHPISQLVYATGREMVTDVWVAGRHLLKDRVLTSLDQRAVLAKARGWGRRIAGGSLPEPQ